MVVVVFVVVMQRAVAHAIVGLVVAGLVLVQLLMGLQRPGLTSPRRLLFNWAHRLLAASCQILASKNLLLFQCIFL